MLGGILHHAGYFLGDRLHKPRESNPKGFFEWFKINKINEEILAGYEIETLISRLTMLFMKKYTVNNPGTNQRWLMAIPLEVDIRSSDSRLEGEILQVINRKPFCYKDPRFSYTLPVWQRYLKNDTVYICMFREPDVTVESILKECRNQDYLACLSIRRKQAYRVWENMYSHILYKHAPSTKNLFFVHYNQVFDGSAIPLFSKALDVSLNDDFVDEKLKRTMPSGQIPGDVYQLYRELCHRAGYKL